MSDDPNEDDVESTMTSSISFTREFERDSRKDLIRIFDELEWHLKEGGVIAALTARGVNASLGLVAIHGLRAYLLEDKKAQAAEDFATVSEEIYGRLAASVIYGSDGGGGGRGDGGGGDGSA